MGDSKFCKFQLVELRDGLSNSSAHLLPSPTPYPPRSRILLVHKYGPKGASGYLPPRDESTEPELRNTIDSTQSQLDLESGDKSFVKSELSSLLNISFSYAPQYGTTNVEDSDSNYFLDLPALLAYRYLLSADGNGEATNFAWVLASKSVPFLPHPLAMESWILQSWLKPYEHDIPVAP